MIYIQMKVFLQILNVILIKFYNFSSNTLDKIPIDFILKYVAIRINAIASINLYFSDFTNLEI